LGNTELIKYIRIAIYVQELDGTTFMFSQWMLSILYGTSDFLNPAAKRFCSDTWKELAVSIFKMNLDQWSVSVST